MQENDKLLRKLEQELKDYKEHVKEQGVDFAIDKAYEIAVKQEMLDSIIYDRDLSSENFVVDDRLDFIIDDYSKEDKNTFDYTLSEEDEKAPVGYLKFNSNEISHDTVYLF